MTSFLDKLNGKLNGNPRGGRPTGAAARLVERRVQANAPAAAPEPTEPTEDDLIESQKLNVDVYQTPLEVILYCQASGADPATLDLTLDEENDVLVIRGARKRPDEKKVEAGKEADGKYIQTECVWEPFYRKIILPLEVDVVKAQAVFKNGVLVIHLPILKLAEGRKLRVMELKSSEPYQPKQ